MIAKYYNQGKRGGKVPNVEQVDLLHIFARIFQIPLSELLLDDQKKRKSHNSLNW